MQASIRGAVAPVPGLRIRRIGRSVAWLAVAGIVMAAVATLVIWSDADLIRRFVQPQVGLTDKLITPTGLPRFAGFLVALIPVSIFAYAMTQLARLFAAFAEGEVFEEENGRRLRRIGIAAVVGAVMQPVARTAIGIALTLNNPPGQRMLAIGFDIGDLVALIAGLALIAFAQVFREAVRLARENGEFI